MEFKPELVYSTVHYWWTLGGEGKSEKLNNVVAWCEIPKYTEE